MSVVVVILNEAGKRSVSKSRGLSNEPIDQAGVYDHFGELVWADGAPGVRLARNGSHHIFVHPSVAELVNLQDAGGQCKPYQVKQVLRLIDRYNLKLGDES